MRLWALWAVVGTVTGLAAGSFGVAARAQAASLVLDRPVSSFLLVVEGDPSVTMYGAAQRVRVVDDAGRTVARARLSSDEPFEDGTALRAVGRIEGLAPDDWGRSRYMAGEVAEIRLVATRSVEVGSGGAIGALRARMLACIDPARSASRALIAGIVCGRTTELNATAAADAFARTGTSHLIAVSGSHLALVSSLALIVLTRIGARPGVRAGVLLALMAAYVVFTGGAASAVRSLIMVGLSLAAGLGQRRGHGLSALALTCMVLVIEDAGVVYDLGFQLSVASVLFIQVFYSYGACLLERLGVPPSIAEALSLTLCAQWGTLPLTIPVFGTCSLIVPVANLVLGPLMSALLVIGLVLSAAASLAPWAADLLLAVPDALAALSIFLARWLSDIPYSSILVASSPAYLVLYLMASVVYLVWADARRWQIAMAGILLPLAIIVHALRWAVFAPPAITVLDVGQADAVLIRDGRSALLVDAGVDDAVTEALARNNVFRLDAVLITHWDSDHCGGLEDVLEGVPVDKLLVAEGALEGMPPAIQDLALPEATELELGDTVAVGGFACSVVWPQESVRGTENADSLVLSVHYEAAERSLDMLLTGDTEVPEEERYAARVGDVDVLKLGHHGSAASVDASVLDALRPELAIASAGEGNSYGHPTAACIEAVEASGARFLCTIDAGDVTVKPGSSGVTVRTER